MMVATRATSRSLRRAVYAVTLADGTDALIEVAGTDDPRQVAAQQYPGSQLGPLLYEAVDGWAGD